MEYREISRATISRLPRYLNFIQKLPKHIRYISATAISKALELGEVQVRKDLSAVCGSGRPKIGYEVDTLCKALECALGVHTECEAVIVGAGRLGMALLGFKGFAEYGITIEKAFDSNKEKCGGSVLPMEKLSEYCS